MANVYSVSECCKNIYSFILTKIFFRSARLIRRPIYIRGKKSLVGAKGLTTGYSCRFDLNGEKQTLYIGKDCQFGDNVHIVAHEKVEIGNDCLLASKIFISDTSHGCYDNSDYNSNPAVPPNSRKLCSKPVYIGNNVWIGENVVILPGVQIGDGCVIGANSVVTKSVEQNYIVAGSPAKKIKYWNNNLWNRVNEDK